MKDTCTRKEKQAGTRCVDKRIIYSNTRVYLDKHKILSSQLQGNYIYLLFVVINDKIFQVIKFSHYTEVIENLPVKDPM